MKRIIGAESSPDRSCAGCMARDLQRDRKMRDPLPTLGIGTDIKIEVESDRILHFKWYYKSE